MKTNNTKYTIAYKHNIHFASRKMLPNKMLQIKYYATHVTQRCVIINNFLFYSIYVHHSNKCIIDYISEL